MFLQESRFRGIPNGSPEWFAVQNQIIHERPLLKSNYDRWYQYLLNDEISVPSNKEGILIEIGSGGSYLKKLCPRVITSDVIEGVAERVIDARKLPFPDESVRAIFMTHSFHHIPNVEEFLKEADRVLVHGGVISMIEVAHTPFSKFFFTHFHPEPYDDNRKEWSFESGHSMDDANQALSWNIFFRDHTLFKEKFPRLKVEKWHYLPYFTYLLSGGVTRKNLVPRILINPLSFADRIFQLFSPIFALHWAITIRKS